MENSQGYPLTEFLLDLTESEELSRAFLDDRQKFIKERGLKKYEPILTEEPLNIQALKNAVRAEVTGESRDQAPGDEDDWCIIRGIRLPVIKIPPPPG